MTTEHLLAVPGAPHAAQQACPLCASFDLRYDFPIERAPASRCGGCGLLFLNPPPPVVAPVLATPDEVTRAQAVVRLDWLEGYLRQVRGRLLLVGADDEMRAEASRRSFQVSTATVAEIEEGALVPGPVPGDAAILCCALETADRPDIVLRAVHGWLSPGGVLMVIAPTLDSRTARLFRTQWWEFTRRNRFYFTADTLQCFLASHHFSDPIVLREGSLVSLDYMRRKAAQLTAWRFRVLRAVFALSPAFLRRRVFGLLHTRTAIIVRAAVPTKTPRLSVIVPVFNERATFEELIEAVLRKTIAGVDIEIVIVESNSTDGTRDLVTRYEDHPRVRVIFEDQPKGKGHAVRHGFAHATGDVILIQDADLEYDIDDYDALVAPILGFQQNFVIGSRHSERRNLWKMRQFNDAAGLAAYFNFGHLLFLGLFNLIYRQRLRDPFSMFKVFRRDCLYGLTFECNRFDFDFELAIKLLRKGYVALELPVNYQARSFSAGKKVNMWRDPLTFIRALAKFRTSPLYPASFRRSGRSG